MSCPGSSEAQWADAAWSKQYSLASKVQTTASNERPDSEVMLNGIDDWQDARTSFPGFTIPVQENKIPSRLNLQLLDLPNEILTHIIHFLDSQSPFELAIFQQPHPSPEDTNTHLTQVSLTIRRLRTLTLPILFRHCRVDPAQLTSYLTFVESNNLASSITSVIAHLHSPCSHHHPAWWARLLNTLPRLNKFNIICAPHIFAELAGTTIGSSDSWAFNMPYQILQLGLNPATTCDYEHISYNNIPSIFTARPWTSLLVNEGSSLKAYTTYEYFLRRTPSLLASLPTNSNSSSSQVQLSPALPTTTFFQHLRSFTYIAIFPFYNHVDAILQRVRHMTSLISLTIKLVPDPNSTVLSDEIDAAKGHIDVNDPWNEFDTSVTLLAHTVFYLTVEGQLQRLRLEDVKVKGIKDEVVESVRLRLERWWRHEESEDEGLWVRLQESDGNEGKRDPWKPIVPIVVQ